MIQPTNFLYIYCYLKSLTLWEPLDISMTWLTTVFQQQPHPLQVQQDLLVYLNENYAALASISFQVQVLWEVALLHFLETSSFLSVDNHLFLANTVLLLIPWLKCFKVQHYLKISSIMPTQEYNEHGFLGYRSKGKLTFMNKMRTLIFLHSAMFYLTAGKLNYCNYCWQNDRTVSVANIKRLTGISSGACVFCNECNGRNSTLIY